MLQCLAGDGSRSVMQLLLGVRRLHFCFRPKELTLRLQFLPLGNLLLLRFCFIGFQMPLFFFPPSDHW